MGGGQTGPLSLFAGYDRGEAAAYAAGRVTPLYVMARQRRKKSVPPSGHLVTPGRVGIILLALAALWLASGFLSKMLVAYRLNAEVAQLQRDTQRLDEQNRGYQAQLSALAQPGGKEEQERLHNYVQHDEKVYVIAQPSPSPTPPSRATASPARAASGASQSGGFWQQLWAKVTSPFH
jgi:cell division protein FtsL